MVVLTGLGVSCHEDNFPASEHFSHVQLVINEVSGHSAQALQAVKILAQYMGNKTPKVRPQHLLACRLRSACIAPI